MGEVLQRLAGDADIDYGAPVTSGEEPLVEYVRAPVS